jgi:hypothetical protein
MAVDGEVQCPGDEGLIELPNECHGEPGAGGGDAWSP